MINIHFKSIEIILFCYILFLMEQILFFMWLLSSSPKIICKKTPIVQISCVAASHFVSLGVKTFPQLVWNHPSPFCTLQTYGYLFF